MKKWNVFAVYAEDSKDVYKMIIPASSKKEAELYVKSGGLEIVKTKEMAELRINVDFLSSYLRKGDFDEDSIDVICRLIQMTQLDMR